MNESENEKPASNNILQGPWKKTKKVKIPENRISDIQEEMGFIEELSENVMVNLIYTLGENGVEITSKEFLQDIAFVIESLKSTLFREKGMPHPLTNIIRSISEVTIDDDGEELDIVATKFSLTKLTRLLEELNLREDEDPAIS